MLCKTMFLKDSRSLHALASELQPRVFPTAVYNKTVFNLFATAVIYLIEFILIVV